MTPEKRKLFFLIAIAAAVAGAYLEVLRHEKLEKSEKAHLTGVPPATSVPTR
jgi:hypothetical protein